MNRWNLVAVAALVILATATRAQAQSSTAQAETLFRQGKDLIAQGKIAEACAAFDASQKLDPTIATLLNQASCREKNGQLATAWGLFLDAERQSRGPADAKLHQVAVDHASKLEPRLSTLTMAVASDHRIRGLEVLRNGEVVDPGAWGKALPVDGGTYRVSARAPGNAEWSTTITVATERDAKTIEIPRLKAAALSASPTTRPLVTPAHASTPHRRSLVLPLVLGGAALALAGTSIGFEVSARSSYDKSKREADNAEQDSLWHSANNKRYVAVGLGASAAVAAGAAVFFYLRSGSETEATSTSVQARLQLQPVLGPDQAGVVLLGGF